MTLTPIDIQQQQFPSRWRGVDGAEVQAFLELVAAQMTELARENQEMRNDLRRVRRELDEYKERENTLKDAMLTAHRAVEDIREQAQKEAELIIGQAEMKVERVLQSAEARMGQLHGEIGDLRRQRARLTEELRAVLKTHERFLEVEGESQAPLPVESIEANVTLLNRVRIPAPPGQEESVGLKAR